MRAGRLRHKVTVEQPAQVQNEYGELVDQWIAVATRRAAVEPLTGRENFAADTLSSESTARIVLRYGSDLAAIDSTWRINHAGTIYDIQSVINPGQRNKEIILMVKLHDYDN